MYVNQNLNTVQISKIIGCSDSAVGRLLERNGVKRFHTPNEIKLNDECQAAICQQYINGATSVELGKQYDVCDHTIVKILKNHNIPIRKAIRRSLVKNHDYFNKIDSVDKAYFLGWMLSDGSIIKSENRQNRSPVVSLELHSKDKDILLKFANVLGATDSIVHDFVKRGHSYIRFASKQMANDLSKYGVVPQKTRKTYLPQIDFKYMPHLIRGYFDGDGTITIDKHGQPHFAFYGSQRVCEDIRNYLHTTIQLNQNKVSKSTCYHVWWGGKTPTMKIYKFLYNDSDNYFLKRKRDKFENYFNTYYENTEVTC